MALRMPTCTVPIVLALCALVHVIAIAAVQAAGELNVPLDALAAGGGVALDRLFHGDLGGVLEALAAILRG
jgi:hypothetical protein